MDPAMMQQVMQNPAIMQILQRPGVMQRLQSAMADPSSAQNDPDMMEIMNLVQNMQTGGGGGGGGYGDVGPSAPTNAAQIAHPTTQAELSAILASAGSKLVVVDYFTTWCGPCKAIAPLFSSLASTHAESVVFVKVDGDRARSLVQAQGVSGFPTFQFWVQGTKVDSFSGADQSRLRALVEEHANRYEHEKTKKGPCPYKHFPLRESEMVKYAEIKWEMVEGKFREINDKLRSTAPSAPSAASSSSASSSSDVSLSSDELLALESLIVTLKAKQHYHSSSISSAQYSSLVKTLRWPSESALAPVANLWRMAVLHPALAKLVVDGAGKDGDAITSLIALSLTSSKSIHSMLIVRVLANCFARRSLGKMMAKRFEEVSDYLVKVERTYPTDANLRLSIVAVYINYAIMFSEDPASFVDGKILLLTQLQESFISSLSLPSSSTSSYLYRLCVLVGSICYDDSIVTELAREIQITDTIRDAISEMNKSCTTAAAAAASSSASTTPAAADANVDNLRLVLAEIQTLLK